MPTWKTLLPNITQAPSSNPPFINQNIHQLTVSTLIEMKESLEAAVSEQKEKMIRRSAASINSLHTVSRWSWMLQHLFLSPKQQRIPLNSMKIYSPKNQRSNLRNLLTMSSSPHKSSISKCLQLLQQQSWLEILLAMISIHQTPASGFVLNDLIVIQKKANSIKDYGSWTGNTSGQTFKYYQKHQFTYLMAPWSLTSCY